MNIESRGEPRATWKTIRHACLLDEGIKAIKYSVRGTNLIATHDIVCINGIINELRDSEGREYRVPNYCINDPYFEKDLSVNKTPDNVKLEVKFYIILAFYL